MIGVLKDLLQGQSEAQKSSLPLHLSLICMCSTLGMLLLSNLPGLYQANLDCIATKDVQKTFIGSMCKSGQGKLYTTYTLDDTIHEHLLDYYEDTAWMVLLVFLSFTSGLSYLYFENSDIKSQVTHPRHELKGEQKDAFLKALRLFVVNSKFMNWNHLFLVTILEIIQLCLLVTQFFMVQLWMNNNFFKFGLEMLTYEEVSPMQIYFPTQAKCYYDDIYGPSGTKEVNISCLIILKAPERLLYTHLFPLSYRTER